MTTNYQFWLTANAESEKLLIPVNPEQITIATTMNNETVNIADFGEMTIIQNRKAMQFSFSSIFPATDESSVKQSSYTQSGQLIGMEREYTPAPGPYVYKTAWRPPKIIVGMIQTWMERKKPIHFVVTSFGIDMYCTIESFSYTEKGGDVGTYEYTITLKEYMETNIREIDIEYDPLIDMTELETEQPNKSNYVDPVLWERLRTAKLNTDAKNHRILNWETYQWKEIENYPQPKVRLDVEVTPRLYRVQEGDTLETIAIKYYGDSSYWEKIYYVNVDICGLYGTYEGYRHPFDEGWFQNPGIGPNGELTVGMLIYLFTPEDLDKVYYIGE